MPNASLGSGRSLTTDGRTHRVTHETKKNPKPRNGRMGRILHSILYPKMSFWGHHACDVSPRRILPTDDPRGKGAFKSSIDASRGPPWPPPSCWFGTWTLLRPKAREATRPTQSYFPYEVTSRIPRRRTPPRLARRNGMDRRGSGRSAYTAGIVMRRTKRSDVRSVATTTTSRRRSMSTLSAANVKNGEPDGGPSPAGTKRAENKTRAAFPSSVRIHPSTKTTQSVGAGRRAPRGAVRRRCTC